MVRLTCWNERGRAEQIRLLLSELAVRWEDVYVSRSDGTFAALQAEGPSKLAFESIPMLEGEGITHADIAVFDILDSMAEWVRGAELSGHPRLQAFFEAVRARPRIAAYLASDRRAKS